MRSNVTHLTIRIIFILFIFTLASSNAQTLPDSNLVLITGGTFTMGETMLEYEGPPELYAAVEHSVTLSNFRMSKTEITNQQYVDFLNAAYTDGLVTVAVETDPGPDNGATLVFGTATAPEEYKNLAIVNLSGTRVMKDHVETSESQDGNPFTGIIEPENPLNISYIGFNESGAAGEKFYVKDPRNSDDFDWNTLTDYYNYTSNTLEWDTSVLLNDYDDWPELQDYPNNLPTQEDVTTWPASFIRWYGAKAFALYYNADLPTEAQWEYAAMGGGDFKYATDDGLVDADGTSANWNWAHEEPALHHVFDVHINNPNPYGLYNMAGNVWEWCEDWYSADFYNNGSVTDPLNTDATSNKKVRRGGSWNYHESTLKAAARASDEQFKGNDHFGFRVVSNVEALPVELRSFSGEFLNGNIALNWRTETELNNYGFEIQRATIPLRSRNTNAIVSWENIGFVEGHGNSNSKNYYSFVDSNPFNGINKYRLKQMDSDGSFVYSEIVEVEGNIPAEFKLSQNYPNPFNPTT